MAKDADSDGRPLVVFTVTDSDPAGLQMAISIARKLQAFRDLHFPDLRFEVVPAALTIEQVKRLGLTPKALKKTEKRRAKWKEAFGVEQTEVDALLTKQELEKNTLRDLVDAVMADYHDDTLDDRVSEAETEWTEAAQAAIDRRVDADRLAELRSDAEDVSEEIDRINAALRDVVDGVESPTIDVPQAEDPDLTKGKPWSSVTTTG